MRGDGQNTGHGNLLETIIASFITLLTALVSRIGTGQQARTARATPRAIDQAAYEMAYRGRLHELAGQHRQCREQVKIGKMWLRQAADQDRPSARAGQNDAINDIKAAITASTVIGGGIRCDQHFLESEINGKLQARIGNRPAAQILQIRRDAVQTAALHQQIIASQMMRRLKMISSVAQFISGIALFGIGALLLVMIPSAWSTLNGLPPETLLAEWELQLKFIYIAVSVSFLGGGIALLFSGR